MSLRQYRESRWSLITIRITSLLCLSGDTLLHYINRQKVSYSEELLLNTVLPIKQIALSSGFEDEKHFMKLFKQYKGVTPSQYRNSFCQVHLNHK